MENEDLTVSHVNELVDSTSSCKCSKREEEYPIKVRVSVEFEINSIDPITDAAAVTGLLQSISRLDSPLKLAGFRTNVW